MKTVMQDLIEIYNRDIVKLKEDFKQTKSIIIAREISTLEHVVTNLESRLIQEKQQIIDGFNAGYRESEIDSGIINNHQDIEMFANAEYYFNDTYKTVSK
jgi:hypothetical protein